MKTLKFPKITFQEGVAFSIVPAQNNEKCIAVYSDNSFKEYVGDISQYSPLESPTFTTVGDRELTARDLQRIIKFMHPDVFAEYTA